MLRPPPGMSWVRSLLSLGLGSPSEKQALMLERGQVVHGKILHQDARKGVHVERSPAGGDDLAPSQPHPDLWILFCSPSCVSTRQVWKLKKQVLPQDQDDAILTFKKGEENIQR